MLIPSWSIPAMVGETRPLLTKEKSVWAYAVKLIAMGGTFETTTKDEALFLKITKGMAGVFTGTFSTFGGNLKLDLGGFEVQGATKPAASGNGAAASNPVGASRA